MRFFFTLFCVKIHGELFICVGIQLKYKNNQSVLVVIYAKESGRVPMLQRRDDADFWQSVTGSLEENKTPYDAAIREIWEEVRLKTPSKSTALWDCHESVTFEIFPHFRYKYAPNVTHCREHWFLLAVEQEFTPELTEHLAFQWVSPVHYEIGRASCRERV